MTAIRCGAPLFVLLLSCFGASPSLAVDFSGLVRVYHETFEGETSFPTTPEIDLHQVGNGVGLGFRDHTFDPIVPGPTLSGGAAIVLLPADSFGVPESAVLFGIGTNVTDSVGFRGSFAGLSATASGLAGLHAAYGNGSEAVRAHVVASLGSPASASLLVEYQGAGGYLNDSMSLGSAAATAITTGAAFTVDLWLDKGDLVAEASVDVAGVGEFALPPLDVSTVALVQSADPLYTFWISGGHAPGPGLDLSLTEIAMYGPFTPPVPALGSGAVAVLCGALAVLGTRRLARHR